VRQLFTKNKVSKKVLKKLVIGGFKMEMCYDGALVMPNSYAVMNEDEMMYIEGGALKTSQLAGMIDLAFLAAGGAFSAVKFFGGKAAKNWLKSTVPGLITTILGWVGIGDTALGGIGNICDAIDIAWSWGSLGGVIANVIDLCDGDTNGYIFG